MPRYIGEIKVVIEEASLDEATDLFDDLVVDHVEELVAEDSRVLRYFGVDVNEDV